MSESEKNERKKVRCFWKKTFSHDEYVRKVTSMLCDLDSVDVKPKEKEVLAELFLFQEKNGPPLTTDMWNDFSNEIIIKLGLVKNKKTLATYKSRMAKKGLIDNVSFRGAQVSKAYYDILDCGSFKLSIEEKDV